ncbi:MAG: hypothetical protein AMXMBFR84_08120 [Candidatus Hydrogenedentota bacterium]
MINVNLTKRGALAFAIVLLGATWIVGCGGGGSAETETGSVYDAAAAGDLSVVTAQIRAGFDVNEPDPQGRTLAHYAAMGNHVSILEYLTEEFNASVGKADSGGKTPLDLAREHNAADAATYLQGEGG